MSHIVSIKAQVRDVAAIAAACQRLQLSAPVHGTAELFAGQQATGEIVTLPGWRYPVVCDTASGELKYDNFEGRWGAQRQIEQFLQAYTVERATLEARRQGHSISERTLADGSIKLTIQVAGGAA